MIDDGDSGAVGGVKIRRGTEVLGENLPQYRFVHHEWRALVNTVMNLRVP
jgi:hypothetical protein